MGDGIDPVLGIITTFHFFKFANMVNVVLHSQKLLAISPVAYFLNRLKISTV